MVPCVAWDHFSCKIDYRKSATSKGNKMETTKKQFRVETTTYTLNPKYIRGSFASTTKHREIASKSLAFFDTQEDAEEYANVNGGFVQELSASGKSYRMIKR